MKKNIFVAYLILTNCLYGQPGALDNAFGVSGKITMDFNNSSEVGMAVTFQADNKILVGGYTHGQTWGSHDFAIARYNSDGSPDNSFGVGGKVTTDFGNSLDYGTSLAVQADGKILMGGYLFLANSNNYDFVVARFNINGSLDSTFGVSGKVIIDFNTKDDYLMSLCVQNDGKIILAGNSSTDFAIARLQTNGSFDSTFNNDGKLISDFGGHNYISSVKLQSDGKILVCGTINDSLGLARYNTNGTIDNSFGSGGKVTTSFGYTTDRGESFAVQNDGKIVAITKSWNGMGIDLSLARFNTNGFLDNTFGIGGKVTTVRGSSTIGSSVMIQSDGKVVVVGDSYDGNYDFVALRYNTNGSVDSTFDNDGVVTTDFGSWHDRGFSGNLQNDGKIVIVGNSYNGSNYDFAIVRYIAGFELGVNEHKENNVQKISPNPSSGLFVLNLPNTTADTQVYIYDLLGNCLRSIGCRNDVNLKVDLSDQPKGLYFIEIMCEGNRSQHKIVIE